MGDTKTKEPTNVTSNIQGASTPSVETKGINVFKKERPRNTKDNNAENMSIDMVNKIIINSWKMINHDWGK